MAEPLQINHDAINNLISFSNSASTEMKKSLESSSDFDTLDHDRAKRNYKVMEIIDPKLAKETLPECSQGGKSESHSRDRNEEMRCRAAIVIQSYYRGYKDRRKFVELLYDLYEKEEEERRNRAAQQVEEGELLVANHTLEVDIEDAELIARNKHRRFESQVITIQRAWRSYRIRHNSSRLPTGDGTVPQSPTSLRKNTLLSQAQHFADLKRQNEDALPYNAHWATLLSDSSSSDGSALSSPEHLPYRKKTVNPFRKINSDSSELTLPQLDWSKLEHCRGQDSAKSSSLSNKVIRDAHREDVRKRLAMSTPADSTYGDLYSRTSNKPLRGQNSAMELYVNECNDETSGTKDLSRVDLATRQKQLQTEATIAYCQAGPIAKKIIAVERKAEEPSQIARMLGISTFRSQGERALGKKRLESLTLAQLQVVYNAIQNEIERLNEELVEVVVARDELHMQQDSILVNVEDLQRRIEELSKRHQKKVAAKESKKAAKESQPRSASSRMSRLFGLGKT